MEEYDVILPYNFRPREYQLPLFKAFDKGFKRLCYILPRRSGKDKSLINLVARAMMERVGTYFYFFPTFKQGRKILWNGMDKDGFKFMDHIPQELRKKTNDQEMMIELINGSIFQIIGTDDIDRIVGTNPIGCVYSEYALQNPDAWGYIRPILAENGGWAIFNYTPRGKNHGYTLYRTAKADPKNWFTLKLTVDDTKHIAKEVLEQEQKELFLQYGDDSIYLQEYYTSFDALIQGAYYGKQIEWLYAKNHMLEIENNPELPVDTFWDLGINDSMCIWFVQRINGEYHILDYFETNGEGFNFYINMLNEKAEKYGYRYGFHYAPHDIKVRELSSGMSRYDIAKSKGLEFQIVPNIPLMDGIQATREVLPKCWFDSFKCERGINCLSNYHKEYDEVRKIYKDHPEHDWASNGSDAFRYFAVTTKSIEKKADKSFVTGEKPIDIVKQQLNAVDEGAIALG